MTNKPRTFLNDPAWVAEHLAKYSAAFARANRLGAACLKSLDGLPVERAQRPALVSCLYARCIEQYNIALLVAQEGWVSPAHAALRGLLETVFAVAAVQQSDEAVDRFIHEDSCRKLKAADNFQKANSPLQDEISPEFLAQLKSEVKRFKARPVQVKELAEWGGLLDEYLQLYPFLSWSAHPSAADLQQMYIHQPDDEEVAYKFDRDDSETPGLVSSAALFLLKAHEHYAEVFPDRAIAEENHGEFESFFRELAAEQKSG